MSVAKITISLNEDLLTNLDRLIESRVFRNRSQAIQAAMQEKIARIHRVRLAQECAKLNPAEEQEMAELGIESEADEWPPY